MFRKSVISFFIFAAVLVTGGVSISAQHAPVGGTVELQKADGTRAPVAGALIEIYRTDIKGGFPSVKTGKNGEFRIAGMMLGATFTFAVSSPGAAPVTMAGVRAGQEKLLITMTPGDGSKFTEAQVRQGGAATAKSGGGTPELTAEQKKAQAEYEAEVKNVTAKNEKAVKVNEIVTRAIKEGNDAYTAKNYDLAIAKYDEGIAADPSFVGSAPTFHVNRGIVLTARAVDTHNRTVKSADASEKIAGAAKVGKDLADAADGYVKGWNLLKTAPATDIDRTTFDTNKLNTLKGARDTFHKAMKTERVDPTTIEAAKVLVPEYIAAETDSIKKAEMQTIFGDLFRLSSDFDNAIVEYRKALEISKDSPDALAGLGLSLVNVGIIAKDEGDAKNDKAMSDKGTAQMQDGLNLLGVFTQVAPDSHPLKASVKETTEYLNAQNKLTPQKVAPAKRRP